MKKYRLPVYALVTFLALLSGGWLLQRSDSEYGRAYERANLFQEVLEHIARFYVDSLDEAELYEMAIDGMLSELEDPYTRFLRANEVRDLTLSTTGNYGGLGIRIDVRDEWITIITPLADTPAERAGLRPADRIVEVEGASTRGWSSERAVGELKGEPGTPVNIKINRPGYPELLPYSITRALIHVSSVEIATMLSEQVGYVALSTVSETSAAEVEEAVTELRSRGARALIFDLRNNPGGILAQGVEVVDLFLERGKLVVETRGRAPGASRTYRSTNDPRWPDMPLVVLVNQLSASAAEIISGALQDHDRALIVGAPTFGKGMAQLVFRLGDNEALRVTTSRWFTPLGRSLNRRSRLAEDLLVAAIPVNGDSTGEMSEDSGAVYLTASGRQLRGGGGINPDVVIGNDQLSEEERAFAIALGTKVPVFRDVLTGYAVELRGNGDWPSDEITVTNVMRAEVLRRLRARDVPLSDSEWEAAQTVVERQMTYELARYLFGRDREAELRAGDDAHIQRALELLEEAGTQEELLAQVVVGLD